MDLLQKIITFLTGLFTTVSVVAIPVATQAPQVIVREEVVLIAVGDVMLGRTVTVEALDKQNDPAYPFKEVAQTLASADLTLINLENPIVESCPRHSGGFKFCAPPEMLLGLTYAGVDIVSLANNHTLNYGNAGIEETQKYLSAVNISHTGRANLVEREVKGTKFGFLGFDKSQQTKPKLLPAEATLIKQSAAKVDVLIVAMHWGTEYQAKALPGVRNLAQEIALLGADVIFGSHPHWVQDYEKVNDIPVYYSLGNFVFDQMWSEKTRQGLVVRLTFQDKKIVKEELLSTYMQQWAQPEWVIE